MENLKSEQNIVDAHKIFSKISKSKLNCNYLLGWLGPSRLEAFGCFLGSADNFRTPWNLNSEQNLFFTIFLDVNFKSVQEPILRKV